MRATSEIAESPYGPGWIYRVLVEGAVVVYGWTKNERGARAEAKYRLQTLVPPTQIEWEQVYERDNWN